MSTVRAKFKCVRWESTKTVAQIDPTKGWGKENMKDVEQRTIFMSPVYGNGDPEHENTKFWQASPNGELRLAVINEQVWDRFELGCEYYLDFTKAN